MQISHFDALTSLPNQISFNKTLNDALSNAKRHQKILVLLFIEIDHFENIYQDLGAELSDKIIQEVSNRFEGALRAGDTLGRLDKGEFGVLLTEIEHPKITGPVAEKLLLTNALPIKLNNQEINLTTSIGIAIFPHDGSSLEELEKNAYSALHRAKQAGGNIYQFSTPQMDLETHEYLELHHALRHALKNQEFVLHYQPQFDLEKWAMTGVEALIRWEHPKLGLIDPLKFISLAEETGLILQIGEWTLYEACRTNKRWQQQGYQPISVAVNLSPKQFYDPHMVETIERVLQETQLEPRYLELEITEMTIMDDAKKVNDFLNRTRAMGIPVSIDDFGTGYTSIRYLKDYAINVLKIDQSFIKSTPENLNNKAITCAIIALAHQLGIKVVAEGVETMEQIQFLAEAQCDMVQGYFISRPVTANKVVSQMVKS